MRSNGYLFSPTKNKTLRTANTQVFNQVIDSSVSGFDQPRKSVPPGESQVIDYGNKAKTLSNLPSPTRPQTTLVQKNERDDIIVGNGSSLQSVSSIGTLSMCRCQIAQVAVSFNVDEILSGIASTQTFSTDKMIRHKDKMNCVDCGAIAFKPESHPNTSQYCYVRKIILNLLTNFDNSPSSSRKIDRKLRSHHSRFCTSCARTLTSSTKA